MAIRIRVFSIVLLFLAILPAFGTETDLAVGTLADVAPFGVEHLAPEIAAAVWFGEGRVRPGILAEVSAWGTRADLSASFCAIAGGRPASAFGGAGVIVCYDPKPVVTPALWAGIRACFGSLSLLPMASIRFKKGDTDIDLRALVSLTLR